MKSQPPNEAAKSEAPADIAQRMLLWVCLLTMALMPLVFTHSVQRAVTLPKYVVLLAGAAAALSLGLLASRRGRLGLWSEPHVRLVALFFGAITLSTIFGVAPLASLFGSYTNQMGWMSHAGFFIFFLRLIAAGSRRGHLMAALWTASLTGFVVAAYAVAQFFGFDPFWPAWTYTVKAGGESVVRVPGTLGNANFLGNFLLYTAPLSAALAFGTRGVQRYIAAVSALLGFAAILFSGTRGAWLGALAGLAVLAWTLWREGSNRDLRMQIVRTSAGAAIAAAIIIGLLVASPAAASVRARLRAFAAEGMSGAGRTLLWRDAARMVPRYALLGAGPEGFSKAFLEYKSEELARLAPQINNESSHNAYLDAAISYGIAGAALYVAIIASAFLLLRKARRQARRESTKLAAGGMAASLAAVAAHNFFIFDQLSTGLYFYAWLALALAAVRVAKAEAGEIADCTSSAPQALKPWPRYAALAAGGLLFAAALWYAAALWRADAAVRQAFVASWDGNFEQLIDASERARRVPDPTGAYDMQLARALADYAEGEIKNPELRGRAIEFGLALVERAPERSLTPDVAALLRAYLAWQARDAARLQSYAERAIAIDPNYFGGHWLLAEAHVLNGDVEAAREAARRALELRPDSSEAFGVLAQTSPVEGLQTRRAAGLIERARLAAESGNKAKAERLLQKAGAISQ